MRKFNHNGLLLAEYQGKLFENLMNLIVLQEFYEKILHSELLRKIDTNNPYSISLDVTEGCNSIIEQFGDSDYGKVKYSKFIRD